MNKKSFLLGALLAAAFVAYAAPGASTASRLFSVPGAPRERGEWSNTAFVRTDDNRLQIGLGTKWEGSEDTKGYVVRWRIKNTGSATIDGSIDGRKYECDGGEQGGNVVTIRLYLKPGESREFEDTVHYTHRAPRSVSVDIEIK